MTHHALEHELRHHDSGHAQQGGSAAGVAEASAAGMHAGSAAGVAETSASGMHAGSAAGMHAGATSMAVSATLHCLTGCAIGEILGLIIGTAAGLGNPATIAVSIALAFMFGYSLSTLPLLKAGLAVGTALTVVLAADTLSIVTMEIVDNAVMAVLPGAMNAGLVNVVFWVGMMISLMGAFTAAFPVNRYLLLRGKGHALTHEFHGVSGAETGWRRLIPTLASGSLAGAIVAFMLGGLVVALADEL